MEKKKTLYNIEEYSEIKVKIKNRTKRKYG